MSYTLVLEWMPGDLYMSAVTARCTAPTSSYSVVWLPPNKVYQITLYCGSTSLVSFLVGAFRGKAWSYMNNKVHVKTGDTVVILSGKDRGKKGKVMQVSPKEGKVIVENANFVQKHVKPRRMGEAGGIIKAEGAIYACKVQVVCPRCGKPTRVGHKVLQDGTKERICKKCGESL